MGTEIKPFDVSISDFIILMELCFRTVSSKLIPQCIAYNHNIEKYNLCVSLDSNQLDL